MRSNHLALPVALLFSGCFQDIIDDSDPDPADSVVSETPVVPAAGSSVTGLPQDASSDSSGGGTTDGNSGNSPQPYCGDGALDPEEDCDDGNDRSGDGCSAACRSEPHACGSQSSTLGEDFERGIGVCKDASDNTCEKDFASLCAPGWHLCSWTEHVQLNDGVSIQLQDVPAVGAIRCRALGGSGHYTSHDFSVDGPDSCEIGSSRVDCPTNLGCNETVLAALCCAPIPSCGNGVTDNDLEECDDGNDDDFDDCSNSCAHRQGSGPFC
ncbi:MAG: DUF4215 domain-containing protein [Nannocystales bacterium]